MHRQLEQSAAWTKASTHDLSNLDHKTLTNK